MFQSESKILSKSQFIAAGLIIIASLFLLSFIPSLIGVSHTAHAEVSQPSSAIGASPNVITQGLADMSVGLDHTMSSSQESINNGLLSLRSSMISAAKTTASFTFAGAKFLASGIGSGATFIGGTIASGFEGVIHITGSFFGFIANTPGLSAVIRPADKSAIPVIDTNTPNLTNTQTKLPEASSSASPVVQPIIDSSSQWPIHGYITTEFGVPDWPYQAIHTGIDISDGQPSGVTPIHPFMGGVVVQTVHWDPGFGNYVVVDHGGGITSRYCHLASISVSVGQQLDKNSVVGYEGSTGVSTGPHLHFEVRLNGQLVNPHKYVNGQP